MTDKWIVRPEDERPARRDGTCYYCHEPVGGRHDAECVIPQKEAEVTFQVRLRLSVPDAWDSERVLFYYNESSWCADNLADLIEDARQAYDQQGTCLCNRVEAVAVESVEESGDGLPGVSER